MATIIISILLFIALFAASRKMINDFRGGGCSGCGGSCPHCVAKDGGKNSCCSK